MSVRVMTEVWAIDLPDSQKIVLLALADCANDEGHCWPSMATLAKKCSKGERTVQGVIKQLVEAKHLTRDEVPGKGCNYYVHPRKSASKTPAVAAPRKACPPQGTAKTPAASADKPSRTVINKEIRAHEIPDGWKPREFRAGTQSHNIVDGWPPKTLAASIEGFTAHHRARGNKFKDWQDAWSTWVLNSRKFGNGKNDRPSSRQRNRGSKSGFAAACDEIIENSGANAGASA